MIFGIDLGTTNSMASIFKDGESVPVSNSLGRLLTPSVIGIDDDGQVLIGQAAKERLVTHPSATTANFKRYMGTNREAFLDHKPYRPEELSALVLKSLKADVESLIGHPATQAIITVPAYFNDTQRKATLTAAHMSGLHVEKLLNEPTAAAIAFGLVEDRSEGTFLVFDLGGGTYDVTVLELFDGVMEIHASAGDNFLGGEDFLDVLIKQFLQEHQSQLGEDFADLDPRFAALLRQRAELVKCALSTQKSAKLSMESHGTGLDSVFTRDQFEQLSEPLLQRLREPLERALRDARIQAADLDEIILVGGATRMPMINRLVGRLFGQFPRRNVDPDLAVGIGAGLQAGMKMRDKSLEEVVLTDVCPYSLGVVAMMTSASGFTHEAFIPIVERNVAIPVSRVERFYTMQDHQKLVDVQVYQGESRIPNNNIFLGNLNVKLPKNCPENAPIDIRFTYDVDGLLEVEVTVVSTGSVQTSVIQENPSALSEKEVQKRLKALQELKIHPRELMINRALMAKADRWYAQTLGPLREEIGAFIDEFKCALETQDPASISRAQQRLKNVLSDLDRGDRPWT